MCGCWFNRGDVKLDSLNKQKETCLNVYFRPFLIWWIKKPKTKWLKGLLWRRSELQMWQLLAAWKCRFNWLNVKKKKEREKHPSDTDSTSSRPLETQWAEIAGFKPQIPESHTWQPLRQKIPINPAVMLSLSKDTLGDFEPQWIHQRNTSLIMVWQKRQTYRKCWWKSTN